MIKRFAIAGLGTFALLGVLSAPNYRPGETIKANTSARVIQVPAFEWHIVSEDELRRIYEKAGGHVPQGGDLKGFSAVDPKTGKRLIFTTQPRRVDDDVTTTFGHEVMHITFGDYHR